MPKVVFTHAVKDVDLWMNKHSERVELFAEWGSNIVGYAIADGGNMVALSIDVNDMDAMQASLGTDEIDRAKEAHGVFGSIAMFVAPE